MATTVAIILAAGSGERLGGDVPKAFLELGDATLVSLAMEAAAGSDAVDALVVVVPRGWEAQVPTDVGKPVTVIPGGATRQASASLGLRAAGDAQWVLVHDAARCLASSALFDDVAAALAAGKADGVVPVVPVADTIKRVRDGIVVGTVDRAELGSAQTPQGFRTAALLKVHVRAEAEGRAFTDDAGMLERGAYSVVAVAGEETNFKITTRADLERARTLLGASR